MYLVESGNKGSASTGRVSRKWLAVSASKSSGLSLTGVNGLAFKVCSTKNIVVVNRGNISCHFPKFAVIALLQPRTSFSQVPPKCGAPAVLNLQIILPMCQSLKYKVSIPLIEVVFELSSSSHNVRPVITDDDVRSPTSGHESGGCHRARVSVQAIGHFYVNCSIDKTCKQTIPVIHWSTQNSNFKWAKINYSSVQLYSGVTVNKWGRFCQVLLHFLSSVVFKSDEQFGKSSTSSNMQDQKLSHLTSYIPSRKFCEIRRFFSKITGNSADTAVYICVHQLEKMKFRAKVVSKTRWCFGKLCGKMNVFTVLDKK